MSVAQKQVAILLLGPAHHLLEELLQLAQQDEGIKWLEACPDYDGVKGKIRELQPDVLLLAPQLPGTAEYRLMNSLWQDSSSATVVVRCPNATDQYILLAFSLGASVCIATDTSPASLLQAMRMAGNGEVPTECNALCGVELASRVKARLQSTPPPSAQGTNANPLTRRERELLQVVSKGRSNRDVGRLLHIQEQTVKNHVSSILRKTHARDRYQAAANALRNGWIALS